MGLGIYIFLGKAGSNAWSLNPSLAYMLVHANPSICLTGP
jgi:hypothetical protein